MQFRSIDDPRAHATAAAARDKIKVEGEAEKRVLGALPEWNLADLYESPDAPELKADLDAAERRGDGDAGDLCRQARGARR